MCGPRERNSALSQDFGNSDDIKRQAGALISPYQYLLNTIHFSAHRVSPGRSGEISRKCHRWVGNGGNAVIDSKRQ